MMTHKRADHNGGVSSSSHGAIGSNGSNGVGRSNGKMGVPRSPKSSKGIKGSKSSKLLPKEISIYIVLFFVLYIGIIGRFWTSFQDNDHLSQGGHPYIQERREQQMEDLQKAQKIQKADETKELNDPNAAQLEAALHKTDNAVKQTLPKSLESGSQSSPFNNDMSLQHTNSKPIHSITQQHPPSHQFHPFHHIQPKHIDHRYTVQRQFMETASHTLRDSLYDIERILKPSEECNKFGGSKFIEGLDASELELLKRPKLPMNQEPKEQHEQLQQQHNQQQHKRNMRGQTQSSTQNSLPSFVRPPPSSPSSILSYKNSAMEIYYAQNVSIAIQMNTPYKTREQKEAKPKFFLELEGQFKDPTAKGRMNPRKKESILELMNGNVREDRNLTNDCQDFYEYPVMLVDNKIDTWNWWFFLQALINNFIVLTTVQPKIHGNYQADALRVMFTSDDQSMARSNMDAYEFMFSDRRGRDSMQLWDELPNGRSSGVGAANSGSAKEARYCFRTLIWTPGNLGGDAIFINKKHKNAECPSSIVYSYAAYLKAAMHIPTLPRPEHPRVVWVGRDTSNEANPYAWQKKRIINNQPEVISHLQHQLQRIGCELIVADYYGQKQHVPFQEQALFVSRANIMIGMHGAGLNMFHFLPFNSVVVEIHAGTSVQWNSKNFVSYVKEGAYVSMEAGLTAGNKKLDPAKVWKTLEEAIGKWRELGGRSGDANLQMKTVATSENNEIQNAVMAQKKNEGIVSGQTSAGNLNKLASNNPESQFGGKILTFTHYHGKNVTIDLTLNLQKSTNQFLSDAMTTIKKGEKGWLIDFGAGVRDDDPCFPFIDNGWEGLLVDGDPKQTQNWADRFLSKDPSLNIISYITADTVGSLIADHGFIDIHPADFLKIDIDSFDCFVMHHVLKVIRPPFIIMETNVKYPPHIRFALFPGFENGAQIEFDSEKRGHAYGCSLSYQVHDLMRPNGYDILHMDMNNAIFFDTKSAHFSDANFKPSVEEIYREGFFNKKGKEKYLVGVTHFQKFSADQIFEAIQHLFEKDSSHKGQHIYLGKVGDESLQHGCFDAMGHLVRANEQLEKCTSSKAII